MRWDGFESACPDIAGIARERFAKDELVLLGTTRRDGSPRISPCEVDFAAGHLFLGMMWRSKKALDLQRDPRIAVHSVPSDRFNPGGDVKLSGRVIDVGDPDLRKAFREEIKRRIDWAPEEPEYHLFSFDVMHAAYISFGEDNERAMSWDPERGLRQLRHPG
ncbi:MAG TPA: pyridoxamine 5'-phosphate oxidase family protein [Actinomycetota bacterium]|jgi:hypothetical protein|nr:pyridoxamine 5'-phosphate oxidase family protein [Actinomycetota bacterium]